MRAYTASVLLVLLVSMFPAPGLGADREKLLSQPGVYGTYAAFKVAQDWWKVDQATRRSAVADAKTVFERHADRVVIDTYLLRGLSERGDFLVRLHATELLDEQNFLIELMATTFGRYLENTHSFLGVTKKANYVPQFREEVKASLRTAPPAGNRPYAVIIPVRKDAEWWSLGETERVRLMQEHTDAALPYLKSVSRKLYHSSGLDDFDFLTYFETANLEDFNHLVIALERVKEYRHNRRFGQPTLIGTVRNVEEILELFAR